jgi:phosphoribosyl-AMP cyclohydrolase
MLNVNFSKLNGLVPVIIQDANTLEVLMQAFMNKEALDLSISTGRVHYFSRTRNKIWEKGETSGHFQEIKEIRIDCDNDSLLIKVHQIGNAACHEGYSSCYFRVYKDDNIIVDGIKVFNPKDVYR